jgi:hypothetical protein
VPAGKPTVVVVADVPVRILQALLSRYDLSLIVQADGTAIRGSFWGDPEAGIVRRHVYVRRDTPVHSLLHEAAHIVCMTGQRRQCLDRDAGGDDIEEAAVCYLQVKLAAEIETLGSDRLMRDMDTWGYSFRVGSTAQWFASDAEDARDWLFRHGLLTPDFRPTFTLRA